MVETVVRTLNQVYWLLTSPLPHLTGYFTYDFFMGRELNPRLLGGTFDLKFFCELRPGLIGWAVLNAAFALKQLEVQGAISPAMWLVQLFQAYYVLDALWFERCILTTVDITTDGFGFMLAFGDLAWVPFTYTLQSRFLSQVPVHLSLPAIGGILALKALGLYIFRSSNLQKDTFRSSPDDAAVQGTCCAQCAPAHSCSDTLCVRAFVQTWHTFKPAAAPACWLMAGGAWHDTSTTWATGSWAWHGACLRASSPPSRTSTLCTLASSSSTGSGETTTSVPTSTAKTGSNTVQRFLRESSQVCTDECVGLQQYTSLPADVISLSSSPWRSRLCRSTWH